MCISLTTKSWRHSSSLPVELHVKRILEFEGGEKYESTFIVLKARAQRLFEMHSDQEALVESPRGKMARILGLICA